MRWPCYEHEGISADFCYMFSGASGARFRDRFELLINVPLLCQRPLLDAQEQGYLDFQNGGLILFTVAVGN